MGFLFFIFFLALAFSAATFWAHHDSSGRFYRIFRLVSVLVSMLYFTWLFVKSSVENFKNDGLSVQVVNGLPQPVDFYLVQINAADGSKNVEHLGIVRPEFYRLENLDMKSSKEFWVAGYLGKNMVYFTQHPVPNINIDQIIDVRTYLVQSEKLAGETRDAIADYSATNKKRAIWVALDWLLIFINIILLFRFKKRV